MCGVSPDHPTCLEGPCPAVGRALACVVLTPAVLQSSHVTLAKLLILLSNQSSPRCWPYK